MQADASRLLQLPLGEVHALEQALQQRKSALRRQRLAVRVLPFQHCPRHRLGRALQVVCDLHQVLDKPLPCTQ
jgi:hypothetical protein